MHCNSSNLLSELVRIGRESPSRFSDQPEEPSVLGNSVDKLVHSHNMLSILFMVTVICAAIVMSAVALCLRRQLSVQLQFYL